MSTAVWNASADVVVVGYGAGGAAAAIAAADAGARVLVLEATAAGGGNCVHSGGFLFDVAPGEAGVDYLDALCFGRTPREILRVYADGLHGLREWLASLGATTFDFPDPPGKLPAEFPAWPYFPGGRQTRRWMVEGADGRPGPALWQVLDAACATRGVEVRHGFRARELVLGEDGSVVGVRGEAGDGPLAVRARGGVLLTCGGFEGDPELADAHLPLPTVALCHQANRGDGLHMGRQAGASEWHLYGCFGWFSYVAEGFEAPFGLDVFAPGFLLVDADGRRFADETGHEAHDRLRSLLTYLPHRENRPKLPSWLIFDEPTRLAGALNGMLGTPNDYAWSQDNSAEIERGWILRADTAAGLAAQMGVEEAVLGATLDAYVQAAEQRFDPLFGRDPATLTELEPPLHAIRCMPAVAGTVGGPRHDERGRVVRPDRTAIPGLYAAGAVSLVFGHLIDFGGGLTDAMVFGGIAARDASARSQAA
ncbi:MAG TPA: FAD-dependent oxidoreductase [Solirubrobacteraceae bacterium]|nr:FAD-dependent oxidoreductase [Solirubrobacteraceae bacterium]